MNGKEAPAGTNLYLVHFLLGSAAVIATTSRLAGLLFIIATRSQPVLLPRPTRAG
jgi:hypothetical protein